MSGRRRRGGGDLHWGGLGSQGGGGGGFVLWFVSIGAFWENWQLTTRANYHLGFGLFWWYRGTQGGVLGARFAPWLLSATGEF
jgi:hypothetical protein